MEGQRDAGNVPDLGGSDTQPVSLLAAVQMLI
jgi:hypothetical protein